MSTHCRNGHERTTENTYTAPNGKKSWCQICHKAAKQRREDLGKVGQREPKPKRPAANGHKFGPKLLCVCGVTWETHQVEQVACGGVAEEDRGRDVYVDAFMDQGPAHSEGEGET